MLQLMTTPYTKRATSSHRNASVTNSYSDNNLDIVHHALALLARCVATQQCYSTRTFKQNRWTTSSYKLAYSRKSTNLPAVQQFLPYVYYYHTFKILRTACINVIRKLTDN